MPSGPIEELLRTTMGLDPASLGTASFERVLASRQRQCGVDGPEAYYQYLRGSAAEFQELIEALVVPETWFFRHPEAFGALGRLAVQTWLPRHPFGVLRILCVPCSSGEEPYTIAMTLLDAGVPEKRFNVEAVDISQVALDRAERAVYGKNSFRSLDLGFRDRYFLHTERGYHVIGPVREHVHFLRGNILDLEALFPAASFDVIFCRNLLIYFDGATQGKILASLRGVLAPGGTAFMGPAEALIMRGSGFDSTGEPSAFAFRHAVPPAAKVSPKAAPKFHGIAKPPPPMRRTPAPSTSPIKASMAAAPPANALDTARQQADSGQLDQAIATCEAALRASGESAQAHYLMGLAHGAKGDEERAFAEYRKAIYLEPGHYEALVHLALLTEKRGDSAGARRLHERARRRAA